jgi:hypothetical protein
VKVNNTNRFRPSLEALEDRSLPSTGGLLPVATFLPAFGIGHGRAVVHRSIAHLPAALHHGGNDGLQGVVARFGANHGR